MSTEQVYDLSQYNKARALDLIAGKILSDGGPVVREGEFFTVSMDVLGNLLILTGFNDCWPERFITHMGCHLGDYCTNVYRWEGELVKDSLLDITDVMMNQVYERMKYYEKDRSDLPHGII